MKTQVGFAVLGAVALLVSIGDLSADEEKKKTYSSDRWEKTIQGFELADKKNPPKPGGVLFLGSSSIRLWKLDQSFSDLKAVNRGFGGSRISDSVVFADRIVLPHRPDTIVFYAGDNDVAGGLTREEVVADYWKFSMWLEKNLPDTRLVYVAIKPSIARWNLWPVMRETNESIRKLCKNHPHRHFADIAKVTIGANGRPDPALFAKDGLHLNDKGYEAWTAVVRSILDHK